jgi:hypothetical protein
MSNGLTGDDFDGDGDLDILMGSVDANGVKPSTHDLGTVVHRCASRFFLALGHVRRVQRELTRALLRQQHSRGG